MYMKLPTMANVSQEELLTSNFEDNSDNLGQMPIKSRSWLLLRFGRCYYHQSAAKEARAPGEG